MRHYSVREKQAIDAKTGRGMGNYHKTYCPHCDSPLNGRGSKTLASRGYYEQTVLVECVACNGRATVYG